MRLVIELASDARFARLAPMSAKRKDERGYEELVTRFFAYGDGLTGYRDRPADFIFDYVKKKNVVFSERPTLSDEYRRRFQETLDFVERIFQLAPIEPSRTNLSFVI
jgi:hypothetical protein